MKRIIMNLLACILLCFPMSLWGIQWKAHQKKGVVACDTLDIYLLIGQSNMAGRGVITDATIVPGVYSLNQENKWIPARHPLHYDNGGLSGVGPGLSFAREMKKHNPQRSIGLVPCAVGGTSITKWKPGVFDKGRDAHPYDDAISRVKCALKSGKLKGILWHQGEGDYNNNDYKLYEARFDSLLNNLSKDLEIDIRTMPVVIGELGRFLAFKKPVNQYVKINTILHQIANKYPNIRCVSSEGLIHKGDLLHFDSPSADELGRRYAEAYLKLCKEN